MKKQLIVIKIGSSSLTREDGTIDHFKMSEHVAAISALKKEGHQIILVSSGAVAAGFPKLGYPTRPITTKGKQAAAAVGQSLLIRTYIEMFSHYHYLPAQVLLTRGDFKSQKRFRNAFSTLTELLDRGLIPIINENDTVAIDELTFGDNDMLSALVAGFIHADALWMMTDIDGIYTANPRTNPEAKRIERLGEITDDYFDMADDKGSSVGTGGMTSKLAAAQTAQKLGVEVFIGNGRGEEKFLHILRGEGEGTYIEQTAEDPLTMRRQWIALHAETEGSLIIDEGAKQALLEEGSSLLPVGIDSIHGDFLAGDIIDVWSQGVRLGKGTSQYDAIELQQILQQQTMTGPMKEVIHRDDWVQLGGK